MRPLLVTLLLLLPAVAGCVDDPSPDSAAVVDPVPDLPEVVAELNSVVDAKGGRGEPSLGVTPDGVLFTNGRDHEAVGLNSGAAYRSMDGGATWERLGAPTAPFPDFDPDLAVDVDGTVWFDNLYLACNAVAVSRDLGESWTTHPAVCNGPVGDRQYVIPTEGGTAYLYYHQLPTFYQTAMKTTDYGRTWLPTGPVEWPDHHMLLGENSGWGGGGFWNPATGSVFFTWTWFDDRGGLPGYAVTRDGGSTWTTATATEEAWGRPLGLGLVVGAADAAGNVYLTWAEADGDDVAVFLATSTDDGETWREPMRVDDGDGGKVFPAITAGPEGKVAIAYYEADVDTYPSDAPDDATWNVTLAWTEDALADEPAFQYGTFSERPVRQGPICPDGTVCQGNREFLDYFSIERMPDGRVAGVWVSTAEVEGTTVNVFGVTKDAILN